MKNKDDLESLMDYKCDLAIACTWLNTAKFALEQATFGLKHSQTIEHHKRLWDISDEINAMNEHLVDLQAEARKEFREEADDGSPKQG